ncbi:MAG: ABC transporter permease [Oscillospiraceae bacterium]|nr:ABC transporter permease [Oscillospiraceae bacterium]
MRVKGWQNVMKFSFIQTVKSKSFLIGTIVTMTIFAIMIALANFLPVMLREDPEMKDVLDDDGNVIAQVEALKVKKMYLFNATELELDFAYLETFGVETESLAKGEIIQEKIEKTYISQVAESEEAAVFAVIEPAEQGYSIRMSRPESTDLINNTDCFALLNLMESTMRNANLIQLGIDEADIGKANAYIATSVNVNGEEPRSEIAEVIGMVITMLVSITFFTLIIVYGQLTSQAIATEKSSRVMELLLTSIQPLAVIVGKVLASTLVVLLSMALVGGFSAAVFFGTAQFGAIGEITGMVETTDPVFMSVSEELGTVFAGFTPFSVVLVLLVFMLGFLFFSLISGLIGASVSKIEDLQTASQPINLIAALGFYLTYFTTFMGLNPDSDGTNIVTKIARYLPISSPFALPPAILTGDISGGELAVSIAVLAACLVVFAIFVAKVYEHIILHNGDRVKIKDMFKLLKKAK